MKSWVATKWWNLMWFQQWSAKILFSHVGVNVCFYFNHVVISLSNWILVIITTERLIAVTLPHRTKLICTRKNAWLFLLAVSALTFVLNIPVLFGTQSKSYFVFDADDINFIIHSRISYCCAMNNLAVRFVVALFIHGIPFCSILCSNIIIVVKLAHAHHARTTFMRTKPRVENTQSMTTTLLMVSFAYLILILPSLIFALLHDYTDDSAYTAYCKGVLTYACIQSAMCINYSINFFPYCIGGKRFRNEFLIMIGCKKYESSPNTTTIRMKEYTRTSISTGSVYHV